MHTTAYSTTDTANGVALHTEATKFFVSPTALGPGVYSVSNGNKYRIQKNMFLGGRARPMHKVESLTAI
jgi:hypothetical protein